MLYCDDVSRDLLILFSVSVSILIVSIDIGNNLKQVLTFKIIPLKLYLYSILAVIYAYGNTDMEKKTA